MLMKPWELEKIMTWLIKWNIEIKWYFTNLKTFEKIIWLKIPKEQIIELSDWVGWATRYTYDPYKSKPLK